MFTQHFETHHFARITYALSPARVKAIFPRELWANDFAPVETIFAGRSRCWLSVTSCLDQQRSLYNSAGEETFEQTSYHLRVTRAGQQFQWLLNASVGALWAVSARHLWALPWHLSAMEFQIVYDVTSRHYQTYRLWSQSELVNANWELADTGEAVTGADEKLTSTDCFIRREGGVGLRQARIQLFDATRGRVLQARCDLLERLGLLTQAELSNPACVTLSHVAWLELAAPIVLPAQEQASLQTLKAA